MSTATKARVDTAYQRLREHLAYLGLSTASEELAPALDRAVKLKLSAVEVLEDLLAKEAEATRVRRLHGRLRFATTRCARPFTTSSSTTSPPSTAR